MLQNSIFYVFFSWNSDDEDDTIFEPERSVFGVLNTSVN